MQGHLSHPARWLHFTPNPLIVAVRCVDEWGRPARRVRIRLGRRIINCLPCRNEGNFHASFRTKPGLKYLIIEAECIDGTHHEIGRRLLVVTSGENPSANYHQWLRHDALVNPPLPAPAPGPLISVLMPVYNAPERWLKRAIASVCDQTYPHWELCIADDASTHPHVRTLLAACAAQDPRIKVIHRPVNGRISAASNSALSLVTGEFTALLDPDDELAPHALAEIARAISAQPEARLLYSDEDKIGAQGERSQPFFKPAWNPDLLLAQNYLGHLAVYHTALLRELGGFREGYDGAQDWDLVLRAIGRLAPGAIIHVPQVLYHERTIPGSTALNRSQKKHPLEKARKALRDHIARTGLDAAVEPVKGGHWRIHHRLPIPAPRVSIIIPTRNRVEILRPCIESILKSTRYPDYELLIVDNGSDDPATLAYLDRLRDDSRIKILRDDGPFNYSALNNRAAAHATGAILAFVNNDIEPISPGWLEEMTSLALRPGTGAVGALLYYPDERVQHAGVVLGIAGPRLIDGVAGHAFKYFPRGHDGSINRLRLVQNYSAVTAACLVVRRSVFQQVGGFDAEHLAVAFNDVDLCLRLGVAGYRHVWTPFAELYHHESASRGADDTPAKKTVFEREYAYMRKTWGPLLDADPAYNPNLTLTHEDFSPSWPPRPHPAPQPHPVSDHP